MTRLNGDIKLMDYDAFTCIAGACPLTCCQEWKIEVDPQTYRKWGFLKDKKYKKLTSFVKSKDQRKIIKLNEQNKCVFLNEQKLCQLVIDYGEEVISETCTTFPRKINKFTNHTEYSLTCACPVVVDLLKKQMCLEFRKEENLDGNTNKVEKEMTEELHFLFVLRDKMIDFLQKKNYSIPMSMMILFYLLLEINEKEQVSIEELSSLWRDDTFEEIAKAIVNMEFSVENTYEENNELFLDLAVHYRKEGLYKQFLEPLSQLAEILEREDGPKLKIEGETNSKTDVNTFSDKEIKDFEGQLLSYENVLRNYVIMELFQSSLLPETDLESMIVMMEWICLEYTVIRQAIYLGWFLNGKGELTYELIRDAIVIIARMTGYEEADIWEYLESSFEDVIWDWGYFALLMGNASL